MIIVRLKNRQFSTTYEERLFMQPTVAKIIDSKPGRKIIGGAIKFLKSPGYKETEKTVGAVGKTIGLIPKNPGRAIRRAAAGTTINPYLTAAEVGDITLSAAVPVYNAIPVNLKMATPLLAGYTKTPKSVQRIGKDMMRNNGSSKASKFGNKLEYYVNKAALTGSRIGQNLAI